MIIVAAIMGGLFVFIPLASHIYGLNSIRSKTAGHGQHGTARWASRKEIKSVFRLSRANGERMKRDDRKIKESWLAVKPMARTRSVL